MQFKFKLDRILRLLTEPRPVLNGVFKKMSGPQGEACHACTILLPEAGSLIADCLSVGTSSGLRCQWVMDDVTHVFMHVHVRVQVVG